MTEVVEGNVTELHADKNEIGFHKGEMQCTDVQVEELDQGIRARLLDSDTISSFSCLCIR